MRQRDESFRNKRIQRPIGDQSGEKPAVVVVLTTSSSHPNVKHNDCLQKSFTATEPATGSYFTRTRKKPRGQQRSKACGIFPRLKLMGRQNATSTSSFARLVSIVQMQHLRRSARLKPLPPLRQLLLRQSERRHPAATVSRSN